MSADKCPHCGHAIALRWDREGSDCGIFECGSTIRAGEFTSSKHCQERVARQKAESDLAKALLEWRDEARRFDIRNFVPGTYGEAQAAGWITPDDCEGHEWDNRTSSENLAWIIQRSAETRRKLEEERDKERDETGFWKAQAELFRNTSEELAKQRDDVWADRKLIKEQLSETRRKLEDVTRFVWGAVHNARPECGSAMARWACVRNALGVGSTTANELCREHGVDPHEVLKSRCDYSEEAQKGGAS